MSATGVHSLHNRVTYTQYSPVFTWKINVPGISPRSSTNEDLRSPRPSCKMLVGHSSTQVKPGGSPSYRWTPAHPTSFSFLHFVELTGWYALCQAGNARKPRQEIPPNFGA